MSGGQGDRLFGQGDWLFGQRFRQAIMSISPSYPPPVPRSSGMLTANHRQTQPASNEWRSGNSEKTLKIVAFSRYWESKSNSVIIYFMPAARHAGMTTRYETGPPG